MANTVNHTALRDSDAPFIWSIETSLHTIRRERDDGEWLYFIYNRDDDELRPGDQGFSSLSVALAYALSDARRITRTERR